MRDNRSAPGGATNTLRGLTHSSDFTREGLAMKATRAATPSAHPIPDAVALRALSRWTFQAPTGCHISTYSVASHGYAQIGWQVGGGKNAGTTAHRAAWTAIYGPIPPGMTIDHTCKSRRCVNVEHLRMLPNFQNARRTSGRDWKLGECAHGHSDEHLRRQPDGKLICDPCNKVWQATYRAKKRSAA